MIQILYPPEVDTSWHARAACHGQGELFFPRDGEGQAGIRVRIREARRLCHTCPVLTPCRQHALTYPEYGIWGGLTEAQRERRRHE